MALNKIKYVRYKSLWTRIGIFFDNHPFFAWIFWMCLIFSIVIGIIAFFASLEYDETKDMDKNKVVYNHVVAIKRYYGVVDTISYHDVDSTVYVQKKENGHIHINVHGKNWVGAEINNTFCIDEVESYKIIK